MTDDARTRLAEATKSHRKRIGLSEAAPSPVGIETIVPKTARELANAVPDSPGDRHYRTPEPIVSAPVVRPWPATAGTSEWAKVAAPLQQAINAAITEKRWPIYICGPVGTGKTCAAACVFKGWSGSVLWYEAADVVSDVIECRMNTTHTIIRERDSKSYQEGLHTIFRLIHETSLLVLNDVGLRKPSDAAYEILMRIIDRRIGKPLVVTSNLDPDRLAKVFDDRIASRLLRGAVIHCVGDDRRSANAKFMRVKASSTARPNVTEEGR